MPLLRHYPLTDTSGTTATDVAGSNPGTYSSVTLDDRTGPFGVPAPTNNNGKIEGVGANLNQYGVAFWVQLDTLASNDSNYTLLNQPNIGEGVFIASADNTINTSDGSFGTLDQTGTWFHVCIAYDGTTRRHYLNGRVGLEATTAASDFTGFVLMAIDGASGDQVNGSMSDFRLYDHGITRREVQYLYQAPRGKQTHRSGVKTL
jgi:hypothetical protein